MKMKRKLIITAFAFICISHLYGQTNLIEKTLSNFPYIARLNQLNDSSFWGITYHIIDNQRRPDIIHLDKNLDPLSFFTFPPVVDFQLTNIIRLKDGKYLMAGNSTISDSNYTRVSLIKTDSTGTMIWRKYLNFASEAVDINTFSDSSYLLIGNKRFGYPFAKQVFFYLFDKNGDSLKYNQPYEEIKYHGINAFKIDKTITHGLFISINHTVYFQNRGIYLLTIDTNLQILSQYYLNQKSDQVYDFDIIDGFDSSLYVSARTQKYYSHSNNYYYLSLIHLDKNFNELFKKKYYSHDQGKTLLAKDSTLIMATHENYYDRKVIEIFKLDTLGNILDNLEIGSLNDPAYFEDMIKTSDGNFLIYAPFAKSGNLFVRFNQDLQTRLRESLSLINPGVERITYDSAGLAHIYLLHIDHCLDCKKIIYRGSYWKNDRVASLTVGNYVAHDSQAVADTKPTQYSLRFENNYNVSGLSSETPLHLQVTPATLSGVWNLAWTTYQHSDYKKIYQYRIYRGRYLSQMQLVLSLNPSVFSYTDVNLPEGNYYYRVEALLGYEGTLTPGKYFSSWSKPVMIVNTSAKEMPDVNAPVVFPNPSSGVFHLQNPANYKTITVFNPEGQIVLIQKHPTSPCTLDLSPLPGGVYFLKAESEKIVYLVKLLKR